MVAIRRPARRAAGVGVRVGVTSKELDAGLVPVVSAVSGDHGIAAKDRRQALGERVGGCGAGHRWGDTHLDVQVAVALDQLGRRLRWLSFPATPAGYGELVAWVGRLGRLERVGVEGAGSGAGLTRRLRARGVVVQEVARPNRQLRRHAGKSDRIAAR